MEHHNPHFAHASFEKMDRSKDAVCGWSTGVQCSLEACSEFQRVLRGEMIGHHLMVLCNPYHIPSIYGIFT